jgi:hypothetical protein
MATVWRSPPDSVPTAWSGPRRLMPILRISSMVTSLALSKVEELQRADLLHRLVAHEEVPR